MPVLPPSLTPTAGEQGLLSADLAALGASTIAAWDLFLVAVERLDPDAPARAKGAMAICRKASTQDHAFAARQSSPAYR